jgi:hypothetical protein
MENIFAYAFATFGHPNDFRQTCFFPEKRKLMAKSFDLTNAIKVFPGSTLYSVRKENINGANCISYAIYTFSKEKLSERDGTFIGSSILFTNQIADENITVEKLNRFHAELISKNVVDERLLVNHSDEFAISRNVAEDFDKINLNLKSFAEPSSFITSNVNLVVLSRTNESTLIQNFKKSLELLNTFDTIFFTANREVIDFAQNRNIYKVRDENGFENEIQILREEKKRQIQILITNYETDLSSLEEKKKEALKDVVDSIERSTRLHHDNAKKIEESKKQKHNLEHQFSQFRGKINDAIHLLKSGKTPEEVRRFHQENKKIFADELNRIAKPINLSSISSHVVNCRGNTIHREAEGHDSHSERPNNDRPRRTGSKDYQIFSLAVLVLWLFTLAYFLIPARENDNVTYTATISDNVLPQSLDKKVLAPIPNNKLDTSELKTIAENIKADMPINEIVKIIFAKNPSDIKKHYESQVDLYASELLKLNKDCFEKKDEINYFIKDTIRNIPTYTCK